MTKHQQNVKTLAVAYHAYMVALTADDDIGISVYGKMLLDMQDKTGIVLLSASGLRASIEYADDRLVAARAAA